MAGYMKAEGLDEISKMLQDLGDNAREIAAAGLYKGAGVVADAFSNAVKSIQTEDFRYVKNGETRLASPAEKAALEGRTGIAHFKGSAAEIDTLIGFKNAGYADVAGKRKPVAVIARSINSGTSFMEKQPVFRRAASKAKKEATTAIVDEIEKKIKELTK